MRRLKRFASSLLLAAGAMLVCAGLTTALGFTAAGMLASVMVIATLLYAGGVWFGGAPRVLAPAGGDTVMVFDRALRIAAGPALGVSLLSQFPDHVRPELETGCRAALRGEHAHFTCEHAGRRLAFDIAPVPNLAGMILYGVLIAGSGAPSASVSTAPAPTAA